MPTGELGEIPSQTDSSPIILDSGVDMPPKSTSQAESPITTSPRPQDMNPVTIQFESSAVLGKKKVLDDGNLRVDEEQEGKHDERDQQRVERKKRSEAVTHEQPQTTAAKGVPKQHAISISSVEIPSSLNAMTHLPAKPCIETWRAAIHSVPSVSTHPSTSPSPIASYPTHHARPGVHAVDHVLVPQQQTSTADVKVDTCGFDLSLMTAKSIKDIRAITYPSNIIRPNPAMNEHVPPGKFFYDREFLLQFNTICKGDVLAEIPLVLLGIDSRHPRRAEPMVQEGYQRGRARGLTRGRGGQRDTASGAMGYTRGRKPADGGIGGLDRLGSVPSVRPVRSSLRPGQAFGVRHNVPIELRTRQFGRPTTEHQQSLAAIQSDRIATAPPALLSRFTAEGTNRLAAKSDLSMESVERHIRALLSALTAENFDSVSSQILEWANKSATEKDGRSLRLVIKLVFDKAKDEAACAPICAKLCRRLWQDISPDVQDNKRTGADGNSLGSGLLLREYLLERYGKELEATWNRVASCLETVEKLPSKLIEKDAGIDASPEAWKSMVSDGYNALQAVKRQALGLIQFISELFMLEMISTEVIHACITKLLFNITAPKNHDVESLCLLLTIVGAKLEMQPKMGQQVRLYIKRMQGLMNNECLTFKTSRLINDVINLYGRNWRKVKLDADGRLPSPDITSGDISKEDLDRMIKNFANEMSTTPPDS